MTREEAIEYFKMKVFAREAIGNDIGADYEAYKIALSALRPVSRGQVEKVFERCQHSKVCGTCKVCVSGRYQQANFCAVCGAPLTDEAVDILLKRLEALHETVE